MQDAQPSVHSSSGAHSALADCLRDCSPPPWIRETLDFGLWRPKWLHDSVLAAGATRPGPHGRWSASSATSQPQDAVPLLLLRQRLLRIRQVLQHALPHVVG